MAPGWGYLLRRLRRIAPWRRWRLLLTWDQIAAAAGALGAHLAGVASAWIAAGTLLLFFAALAGHTILAMAQTVGSLDSRLNSLEKQHADLASRYKTQVNGTLNPLLTADISFLASITGPMAHQTTANNAIDGTAGALSSVDRTSINGLINAVNGLQAHLQSANIES